MRHRTNATAMAALGTWGPVGLLLGCLAGAAHAAPGRPSELSPEEMAERDALITKMANGQDYEPSLARFVVLYRQREALRADEVAEQKRQFEAHQRRWRAIRRTLPIGTRAAA